MLGASRLRLTNGRLDGLSSRIRLISQRRFGFDSAAPLVALGKVPNALTRLASKERLWASRRLVQVGALVPDKTLHRLNRILNYLEAGRWMHRHSYPLCRFDPDRYALFRRIAAEISDEDVLYVEFGVAKGDTVRLWSKLLRNPKSALHGFDSFEGLPTSWPQGGGLVAGTFSRRGQIPIVDDPRVRFFKGWFGDTLCDYDWPDHDRLIVNIDSDLYSSAVTVLDHARPYLKPGSLLYFDEFNHRADELRAFDEFLERTGMDFELVGATPQLTHVMFRRALGPSHA
jgi:hypothetical protein